LCPGQFQVAYDAAQRMRTTLSEYVESDAIMAKYFEAYIPTFLHVLIRFGKWDDILLLPVPTNPFVSVKMKSIY
jgi:hypothetical protein